MSTRDTEPLPAETALITARGLKKSYGRTEALRGASLDLHAGEVLAVTGTSGSGKSTLLHCLAGIVHPDEGVVTYGREQLDRASEERLSELRRSDFGVVFQFGQLIPELTALDNVALPLLLTGIRRRPANEQAAEWLERFGIRGQADLRPGEMSGGQSQRVALARAMVTGPKAVFADEPTGALDSLAGEQVMTALVHAARESATAVLLITHAHDPWAAARTHAALLLVTVVGVGFMGVRAVLLADLNAGVGRPENLGFYTTGIDLAGSAVLIALAISLCGLAVGTAESLATRCRGLAVQAAAGVPRAVLARAALLETALPLAPAVLLAGAGGTALYLVYAGIVGTGPVPLVPLLVPVAVYAACLLAAATSLPLLRRVTHPSELRFA